MKGKWHLLAGVALLLACGFNLFAWGGLAKSATLGPVVSDAASRELALAGIYVGLGRLCVDATGTSKIAATYAESAFQPLQARLLANPGAAMETLVRDMPTMIGLAYYGVPVLLLVFVVLWWRRPRVLHSIRTR
jgi:hypothetical protein